MKGKTSLTRGIEMDNNKRRGKTDRIARLMVVISLLYHNPDGLWVTRIAQACGVCQRTTRNDVDALEALGFPIWKEKGRRGLDIEKTGVVPPILLTIPEVLNIFLAARLFLHHAHRYDPDIATTFMKLSPIVPPSLSNQIQKTIAWMKKQPRDDKYLSNLAAIARAWILQRRIKIAYKALQSDEATERIIEPYFIEPATAAHSTYVVAYCHRNKTIRTFKVDRIESTELTSENYNIPTDFDANAYLSSAWGIFAEGEVKTVKLRFAPQVSRVVKETVWHSSQVLKPCDDGSVIMTVKIADTVEFRSWLLSWGEKVEVLEPKELRQLIINNIKAMSAVYQEKI